MGIRTLADLGAREEAELKAAFGPRTGFWLHRRGRLEDDSELTTVREAKSQSTERTFDFDVGDRTALKASLTSLSEELCRRLRGRDLRGRTIGIKVRLDDWTNVTRSHTVERPTNDPAEVTAVALDLLEAYDPPRPVRLLGVRVAQFGEAEPASEGGPSPAEAEPEPQLRLGRPAA
jgi:DNA polymerase-4